MPNVTVFRQSICYSYTAEKKSLLASQDIHTVVQPYPEQQVIHQFVLDENRH